MPALYNVDNILEVLDHKFQSNEIHFHCKVKTKHDGKLSKHHPKEVWIDSSDSDQIHYRTLSTPIFTTYFSKFGGYTDFKTFKRNVVLDVDDGTKHYLITTTVIINDDESKKAAIKMNENFTNEIYQLNKGVPNSYFTEATRATLVFPPKIFDEIFSVIVLDQEGVRHCCYSGYVNAKFIAWDDKQKTNGTGSKSKKQYAIPHKPGSIKGIVLYTNEYAAKLGFNVEDGLNDFEDVNKNRNKNIKNTKKLKKNSIEKTINKLSKKVYSEQEAVDFLLGPGKLDVSNQNKMDLKTDMNDNDDNTESGSYDSSFVSKKTSNSDESEYDDKMDALREERDAVIKQKKKLKKKIKKLEQENKKLRHELNKLKRKKQKKKYKYYSSSSSSSSNSSSGSSSSSSSKRRRKRHRRRKDKRNKRNGKSANDNNEKMDDSAKKSGYKSSNVHSLIYVQELWTKANEEGVEVGKYALHSDGERPQVCKDANELCSRKKLLKYIEHHGITINASDKDMTLKKWGSKYLPTKVTCYSASRSYSMKENEKPPPMSIINYNA